MDIAHNPLLKSLRGIGFFHLANEVIIRDYGCNISGARFERWSQLQTRQAINHFSSRNLLLLWKWFHKSVVFLFHTGLPYLTAAHARRVNAVIAPIAPLRVSADTDLDSVIRHFRSRGRLRDYSTRFELASAEESRPVFCSMLADVYKITLADTTRVAVKSLRFLSGGQDKTLKFNNLEKRAARELEIWRALRHENILELHGFALFRGKLCMVSPWMENGDVNEYLKRNLRVNRYQICAELVNVVAYLHDQNVVHGDLRGGNVLVSDDGRIKLTDFGLTIMSQQYLEFSKTDPGGGTQRWMAPELLNEDGVRCKETDIYALGMTMLEIITGKPPFEGISFNSIRNLVRITEGTLRPQRPAELMSGLVFDDHFWGMLESCWKHRPDERLTAQETHHWVSCRPQACLSVDLLGEL
ncbi:hypothetical protein FRC07_006329 [Ceratobasidium sp. 392]|nr:hypothetical protein FRC07_006329 [Ceratobasidium sp. 392]